MAEQMVKENRLLLPFDKQRVLFLGEEPSWRSEGRAALTGASITFLCAASQA